jgi:hypothetical protein
MQVDPKEEEPEETEDFVKDEFMDYTAEEQQGDDEDDGGESAESTVQLSEEELAQLKKKADIEEKLRQEQEQDRIEALKAVTDAAAEEDSQDQKKVNRLAFLMQQSEVFAHFMTAGQDTGKGKKGKKAKATGKRGRMGEEVEDAIMTKQSDKSVRLTKITEQPKIISEFCNAHCYLHTVDMSDRVMILFFLVPRPPEQVPDAPLPDRGSQLDGSLARQWN